MLNLFLLQTWFCNTRASRRQNPKPRARLQINNEDKEFLNYLVRNQPQILPYFSMIPRDSKNQQASHQKQEFRTCPMNKSEALSQKTCRLQCLAITKSQPIGLE